MINNFLKATSSKNILRSFQLNRGKKSIKARASSHSPHFPCPPMPPIVAKSGPRPRAHDNDDEPPLHPLPTAHFSPSPPRDACERRRRKRRRRSNALVADDCGASLPFSNVSLAPTPAARMYCRTRTPARLYDCRIRTPRRC